MMSRRRSHVGVSQHGVGSIALLCVAALLMPSLAGARSRRTLSAGPDGLTDGNRDATTPAATFDDGTPSSGEAPAASDVPAEQPPARESRSGMAFGASREVDEHVHIRRRAT